MNTPHTEHNVNSVALHTPAPCIGYVRVSTERQAEDVRSSLADQAAALTQLAERLGTSVGRWFQDTTSGATAEGRRAFTELLKYCAANPRPKRQPGYVVVLNTSRFGRFDDPEESAYHRHALSKHGWIVRFAEGDAEGDAAPIVRAVGDVEASTYRRNLRRNVRRGMKGSAEQGYWTREAPYAYRRQVVHPPESTRVLERGQLKAPNEKVKLTPHEEEAAIVAWAYRAYADREHSACSLARELEKLVPWRSWGSQVVIAMLRNPAYMGDVVGGRRRSGESEYYGCRDAHAAIVSRQLWQAAQDRIAENRKIGKGVTSMYLLSGLMRCRYCGEAYVGGGGGTFRGRQRRFYRDNGGMAGTCPGRIGTVMRHLVDGAVVETIVEVISDPAMQERIAREIDRCLESAAGSVGETNAQLRAHRSRLAHKRDRLVAAVADGTVLQEEAATQLQRIRADLEDVGQRIEALRFRSRRARGARAERDALMRALHDFPDIVERASTHHLRKIVQPLVKQATFDKGRRTLSLTIAPYHGFLPAIWPARG